MINIDKQLSNSLNSNVDINVHCSTLYNILKEGINGFPSINYKYDSLFSDVIGFNDNVDELSIELYMSSLINDIINYYNTGIMKNVFKDIPELVVYQLTLLYGLTSFKDLFTKINKGTSFVFNSLWKSFNTNTMKLSELKNIYGKVDKCYNVNTVSVFESFYKGDLNVSNNSLNELIDIEPYDNTDNKSMREGTETVYFKDTLKIPFEFLSKYCSFKSNTLFKNTISSIELDETGSMNKSNIMTSDNISIPTLSKNTNNIIETQTYDMYLETNVKKFIDKFVKDNNLKVISYGSYPYNQYMYQKPGDSKIIQSGKKTILKDDNEVFLKDGSSINIDPSVECKVFVKDKNVRDGHYGKYLNYVSINGWQLISNEFSISSNDMISLTNNDVEITYEFKQDNVKYRIGNMFNNQKVYEIDREVLVSSWIPFKTNESKSSNINNQQIYLQNKYSYGSKVSLNKNQRTACRFVFSNDLLIYTEECKHIIQKLGKLCLYYFINDCIDIIQKYNKETQIAISLLEYTSQMNNKKISGLFEESPFITYILYNQNKTIILNENEFKLKTESYPLEISQESIAKDKLLEIHLPKLEIYGNNIRFSTTNHSDYNRYYIYGDSSYWKLKSIPINVNKDDSNSQMIDNMFLIHNEIFNESYPMCFNNFNVY